MTSDTLQIMTVLGPIRPDELGPTYMHEHLIVDCSFSGNDPRKKHDEPDVLAWEMKDVARAGGRTVVDCTCTGLGPDPAALKRIAEEAGVHVITSTGFYRYVVYPDYVATSTADDLARRMIRHCEDGFGDTGVRPGMLAEFASHDSKTPAAAGHDVAEPPNEDVEKVFRAAARAHLATGLPITTHCPGCDGADWEIDLFRQEGVDLSKLLIAHVALLRPDLDRVRWILEQGANIGVDGIGYGERDGFDFFEHGKAQLVKTIIEWGHIDQVTISLDMCRKYHLKKYGGHGFAFLMDCFVPLLREVGLTDEEVDHILVENPKRILTPHGACSAARASKG